MIIPVRCFTCGKVLGDKWAYYERRCRELGDDIGAESTERLGTAQRSAGAGAGAASSPPLMAKTERGKILDELGITSCCCRTVMLTHVDMMGVM